VTLWQISFTLFTITFGIDSSEFLGEDDIQKYQSLIGAMQWAISIGCFDIAVHVMTMSSFRASPHHGHLE
jgi:hypothetical protein